MPESLSPYALLCASKPKPTPTVVTPYDLYSAAQTSRHAANPPSFIPDAPSPQQGSAAAAPAAPRAASSPYAAGRTHYIADIHARHNRAIRHQSRHHSL